MCYFDYSIYQLTSDLVLYLYFLYYSFSSTDVKLNLNVYIVHLHYIHLPVFLVLSPLLQLATEYGIKFMETSAKASINVEEVSKCDRPHCIHT